MNLLFLVYYEIQLSRTWNFYVILWNCARCLEFEFVEAIFCKNSNRYFDSKEVTSKIKHIMDKIFRIFVLVCVSGKPQSLKLKVSSFPGKIFEFSFWSYAKTTAAFTLDRRILWRFKASQLRLQTTSWYKQLAIFDNVIARL